VRKNVNPTAAGMLLVILLVVFGTALFGENREPAPVVKIRTRPKVEVVFVLDTTGSMSGLIEGAKRKIWFIANEIIKAKPTPELKIGLVAFRDKGDEYVTRAFGLTDDIDKVYSNLMSFKAAGGGDTPEHVNKALNDAVYSMQWDTDKKTLKIVFLVGDSPPHMDYRDGYDYRKICPEAVKRDLIINTIRCGGNAQTAKVWQEIARLSEGTFITIAQSGAMRAVSTPMDEELAKLNLELEMTRVAYGGEKARRELVTKAGMAAEMAAPAAADRALYEAESKYVSDYDLISRLEAGVLNLDKIDEEKLPEKLKKMSGSERQKYLMTMVQQRRKILERIRALNTERSKYIKKHLASDGRRRDSFDEKVIDVLKKQAERKGIRY